MTESGIIQRWSLAHEQRFYNSSQCYHEREKASPVRLASIVAPVIAIASGLVSAIIVLLIEILLFKIKSRPVLT